MNVTFFNMNDVDISAACLFELYSAEVVFKSISVYGVIEVLL